MNKTPKIGGLMWAQFTGAFNDNAWKLMVFTLATRTLMIEDGALNRTSQLTATLLLMTFLLPMFIFSIPAGAIADRFSKRSIIVAMKVLEVILMSAAAIGLYIIPQNLIFPYALLALMGVHSAIFSPAKYGILPEIVPNERLSNANGLLEMWCMIAIIGGTGLGPLLLLADAGGAKPWLSWTGPAILTALSLIGLFGALRVPKVPPACNDEEHKVFRALKDAWGAISDNRILWLVVVGNMTYWMITSLIGQNVLVYAKAIVMNIEKGELLQGAPPAAYGLGIAVGAIIAGKLSGDKIEPGLIPFGALGFSIVSLMLGLIQPGMWAGVCILICMGIAAGIVVVPLNAILQSQAPKEYRGAVIAFSNIFNIIGMMGGSIIATLMTIVGLELRSILIVSALLVMAVTAWSVRLLPFELLRIAFLLITRFVKEPRHLLRIRAIAHQTTKGS